MVFHGMQPHLNHTPPHTLNLGGWGWKFFKYWSTGGRRFSEFQGVLSSGGGLFDLHHFLAISLLKCKISSLTIRIYGMIVFAHPNIFL